MSSSWSSDSSTLVDYTPSAMSRDNQLASGSRFWRFDWKRRAPALGFRNGGTDLTMNEGHALSFTEVLDDHGFPFAVVELRGVEDVGCIVVIAKRRCSTRARNCLSLTERMRLGMHAVRRHSTDGFERDLHESLKRASKEYVPRKLFGTMSA